MDPIDMMTQALSSQQPNALQKLYHSDLPTPGGLPFFGTPSREAPTELDKWHMARRPMPDYVRPAPGWGDAAHDFLSVAPMLMGSPMMRPGTGTPPQIPPFKPSSMPEIWNLPDFMRRTMEPANQSHVAIAGLPLERQLEYQRLIARKGPLVNELYDSPAGTEPMAPSMRKYTEAQLQQNNNRLSELRDLMVSYQKAKKLGIKPVE